MDDDIFVCVLRCVCFFFDVCKLSTPSLPQITTVQPLQRLKEVRHHLMARKHPRRQFIKHLDLNAIANLLPHLSPENSPRNTLSSPPVLAPKSASAPTASTHWLPAPPTATCKRPDEAATGSGKTRREAGLSLVSGAQGRARGERGLGGQEEQHSRGAVPGACISETSKTLNVASPFQKRPHTGADV